VWVEGGRGAVSFFFFFFEKPKMSKLKINCQIKNYFVFEKAKTQKGPNSKKNVQVLSGAFYSASILLNKNKTQSLFCHNLA